MNLNLNIDPVVSFAFLLIPLGLAVLAASLAYFKAISGLYFRAAFMLILLAALLNPAVIKETRQYLEDKVLVFA